VGELPRQALRVPEGRAEDLSVIPRGQREFCGTCGTQIAYREVEPTVTVDVNLATLDAPESVKPRCHIWTDSRISWFDTTDRLPRYAEGEPD
jgi:hypothetical protein